MAVGAQVDLVVFDDQQLPQADYAGTGVDHMTICHRDHGVAPLAADVDALSCRVVSPETELDFVLVALGDPIQAVAHPSEFGFCPLSDTEDRHQKGMNVNVIQHPGGVLKMIAVRNNILTHRTSTKLLYETDTLKGSSGAPVFNDGWDIVALHHYGAPSIETDEHGNRVSAGTYFYRLETSTEASAKKMVMLR